MRLTRQQYDALPPRLKPREPEPKGPSEPHFTDVLPKSKRIRQSSKPLMNKLESEFYEHLKNKPFLISIRPQAITFRLANGLKYTPDFTASPIFSKECQAFEVKGPKAWDDSIAKLKMAAAAYPDWSWLLVWKDGGEWKEQVVLP